MNKIVLWHICSVFFFCTLSLEVFSQENPVMLSFLPKESFSELQEIVEEMLK